MDLKLHVDVFKKLLELLEELVENELKADEDFVGQFTKQFAEKDSVSEPSNYFGVSKAKKDVERFPRVFGNALMRISKSHISRYRISKYSRRRLYSAYVWYEKHKRGNEENGVWIEKAFTKSYLQLYLSLLSRSWSELLDESGLEGNIREQQEGYWEAVATRRGQRGEQKSCYLLSYIFWDKNERELRYALVKFMALEGEENLKGKVAVVKTPSKKDYKGVYVLLKEHRNYFNSTLKIEVLSDNRPLVLLIHKHTTLPFTHFKFLLGNFIFIDKDYQNIQGAMLLEHLPEGEEEKYEKMENEDLKAMSSLRDYDKLLLYWHLQELNRSDILPKSVFDSIESLRNHMKEKNAWWGWHKGVLERFFAAGNRRFFYLYFLAKRKIDGENLMFLARYPMRLEKTGEVKIWGKAKEAIYIGEYRAEEEGALHVEVRKLSHWRVPDYFHFFLQEKRVGKAGWCLKGLYAGWRMKITGLSNFSGGIVAVPVVEKEWSKGNAAFFSLDPDVSDVEEPAWRAEVRSHPDILSHLLGLKERAVDNGLSFLPGALGIYERGALHEDLKSIAGIYYYYRTRTRPGRQYTVKAYAVLIDEDGFVYVKSHKAEGGELLYRGVLVRVKRRRADTWSVLAVLQKSENDFGGTLILERPSQTVDLNLDYHLRGIHLSLNYYGDPIAGRLYFVRVFKEVNWDSFKKMKSPMYFVEKWDKHGNTLRWYLSEDLNEDGTEKTGAEVVDPAKLRLLNQLCGQINNFLSFRRDELGVRTNKLTDISESDCFYPALFKGSYAEDVLHAAVSYWKAGDKKRFRECFLIAILCGGYSHIGNLRAWFVEDPGMAGCKKDLLELPDAIRGGRGVRPEKRRKRIEFILKEMFSED